MRAPMTRRQFTRVGLGGLATGLGAWPLLEACGFASGGQTATKSSGTAEITSANLQLGWWGGADRAKRTQQVMDLFKQKHAGWTLAGQSTSFNDYWTKMNTQAAAGGLPDVMQMDMAYIGRYVQSKQLLALDKYRDALDLGDFDKNQLAQGTVGGKLYGISLGGNIGATMFNRSAIERAGMQPPDEGITWEEFATYLSNLAKKLPAGMYPIDDPGFAIGVIAPTEIWVRQRRSELWTKDGKPAFKSNDMQDWFQFWADLRKAKLTVPPEVAAAAAQNGTPAGSTLATGKSVFLITWSNFTGQYQILMKDTVGMMRDPMGGKGAQVGDYVKASQLFTIPSTSKSADAAAQFISFFVHDADAAKVLGVERGVPGSARSRSVIADGLQPPDKAQITYFDDLSKRTRAKGVLDPAGTGDVSTALTNAWQSIALSGVSVADATRKFMDDSARALNA
ncbi:MAG TPA: extracellular solute-binding protein [Candidatus Dormibacteraeota bacterium]|nr:extracellular solute-binding protein [Candidatus Dormibacteraeota bacterium]